MKNKSMFKYIRALIIIALPIIFQQLFLNIASLIDTMMVGQLDNASVSGVYVASQIVFVINLAIFGATEGGSVFFSQFFGSKDNENMKKSLVFKLYFSSIIAILCILIVNIFANELVTLFVSASKEVDIATNYLRILSISFIPYAITNSLASSMRESHKTLTPMIITLLGICINTCINYLLIFGIGIFPHLGPTGAAIGTVIERLFEMAALIVICLIKKYDYTKNIFKSWKIDKELLSKLITRSIPLIINEILWALSQTVFVFCFTKCDSLATVALPIATTLYNLVFVVCLGIGQSITILIGNTIGEKQNNKAQKEAYYSLLCSFLIGVLLGGIVFIIAPFIVKIYTGVSSDAASLAKYLIRIYSVYILINAVNTSSFFIIRSGGKTLFVLLFDSVFGWFFQVPFAFLVLRYASLPLKIYFPLILYIEIIKIILGLILIVSKKWINNLTVVKEN